MDRENLANIGFPVDFPFDLKILPAVLSACRESVCNLCPHKISCLATAQAQLHPAFPYPRIADEADLSAGLYSGSDVPQLNSAGEF